MGNLRGALIALASFAIFSAHDVLVKVLGTHLHAVQIVFFAGLFGVPWVTLLLIGGHGPARLRPRHPWWMALRAACVVITGVSAFHAFSVLPLAETYAILFAGPLFITLLAVPMLGERVGPRRAAAVAAGLVGVLIVLRPGVQELTLGHLAALTAALSSSLVSIVVRRVGRRERPETMLLLPMLSNLVVMGAALPQVYRPPTIGELGLLAVAAALNLAASRISIAAYRSGEAVVVAPMQYSQMLWAVFWGWLVFAETPDRWTLAGAAVIIASGLYIVLRESRVSHQRPVLASQTRPETAISPRIATMVGLGGRPGEDRGLPE